MPVFNRKFSIGVFLIFCVIAFLFFPRLTRAQSSQTLVIDPSANFSDDISGWPEAVVPIFPGASPVKITSCLDPRFCFNPTIQTVLTRDLREKIRVTYLLEVRNSTPKEVYSWYQKQLTSSNWTYITPLWTTADAYVASYEKCWTQDGVLQITVSSSKRLGDKTGIDLILSKYNPGFQGSERCLATSVQNNFEGAGQSTNISVTPRACTLAGITKIQATEIKLEIKEQFNIDICESNLCSFTPKNPEHEVSAWTPTQLSSTQFILEQFSNSCLFEKLPIKSVCKASSGIENNNCYAPDEPSAYYSSDNQRVVFCYDRWGIKDKKKIKNEFIGEDEQLLSQLLAHEIGHAYWRNDDGSLNFDKIADWLINTGYIDCINPVDCWGVAMGGFMNPPSDAPSEYAQTSPAEDFAESIRFYVTQPDKLLSRSALRYKYLKDQVFCGKEYQTMEVSK